MWVLGGSTSSGASNEAWSSTDGETWTLETESAEWSSRREHTTVVFDNKMWVLGGRDSDDKRKNDVWCSVNGIEWVEVTSSAEWSPRFGHSSVVFDEKLWIICGITFEATPGLRLSDVWCSENGSEWTETTMQINEEIIGLADHATVVFKDRLWVLGGNDYSRTIRSGRVYSSTDGIEWREPEKVGFWVSSDFPSVVYDEKIWVLGGVFGGEAGIIQNSIWTSPDGMTWTEEMPEPNWSERYGHTAVVYKDRIWVLGGRGLNDVWYSNVISRESDLNEDGKVDSLDLLTLVSEWQKSEQE